MGAEANEEYKTCIVCVLHQNKAAEDKKGLPVGCTENSGLTSEAQDKEKQGGGFNGEYVGAVRGCSPPL